MSDTAGAAPTQSPVLSTVEEIVETITHTNTPQASTGVLLDWVIGILKNAIGLGGMGATTDAVKAHVADLEANKDALSTAVATD